jgi:hypothetical protein
VWGGWLKFLLLVNLLATTALHFPLPLGFFLNEIAGTTRALRLALWWLGVAERAEVRLAWGQSGKMLTDSADLPSQSSGTTRAVGDGPTWASRAM